MCSSDLTVKEANGLYALVNNSYRPLDNIVQRDQKQLSIKGDHNFSAYHKVSGSYSFTSRPRYQTGAVGTGIWDRTAEHGGPLSGAQWQFLKSGFTRAAYDWTISPVVMNNFMVYYNRNTNVMPNAFVDVDGLKELGIPGMTMQGYPTFGWDGGPYVRPTNPGGGAYYFTSNDAGGIQDTLSFSRGRHFFKIGADWRQIGRASCRERV